MSPDVAASVQARLLNQAKRGGEEFERTLVRFAGERFLYRLGASQARDRCLLKGAALLAVWLDNPHRATRDIDLLVPGADDDAAIQRLLTEILAIECPEDGVRFDITDLSIETIRAEDEYAGKRARFLAFLGKARVRMQLDIGVGDAVAIAPEKIVYPTMLLLPAPSLMAYPRETSIAEKFEAMVQLDIRNSRMKDFHDVWALAGAFSFDGPKLQRAVAACFERRGTPLSAPVPGALTAAFYGDAALTARWRSYLEKGGVLMRPPGQFDVIGEQIIRFLGPVRTAITGGTELTTWPIAGPWS